MYLTSCSLFWHSFCFEFLTCLVHSVISLSVPTSLMSLFHLVSFEYFSLSYFLLCFEIQFSYFLLFVLIFVLFLINSPSVFLWSTSVFICLDFGSPFNLQKDLNMSRKSIKFYIKLSIKVLRFRNENIWMFKQVTYRPTLMFGTRQKTERKLLLNVCCLLSRHPYLLMPHSGFHLCVFIVRLY